MERVSALPRQIPWTHHLLILVRSRGPEERESYLRLVAAEKWASGRLERELKLGLFDRAVSQPAKFSAALRQSHPEAAVMFKDACMLDFPELPHPHSEADLLVKRRRFLIEPGQDFCFGPCERTGR